MDGKTENRETALSCIGARPGKCRDGIHQDPERVGAAILRPRGRTASASVLTAALLIVAAVSPLAASDSGPADNGPTSQAERDSDRHPAPASGRVACNEAPDVFRILCTAYEVITADYVDEVEDRSLAEAAAEQVREADLEARTSGEPPACPLPTDHFEVLCAAIDAVEDTEAAVEEAIRGMARSLDSNSYYLTTEQYRRFRVNLENRGTSGLGVAIGLADDGKPCSEVSDTCRPVIAEVYAGSPAHQAELRAGDVLVEFGDPFPADLACEDVSRLDRFEAGEEVTVVVRRGSDTIATTVTAADLAIPVARGRVVDGNIAHLRLDVFSSTADDKVASVLRDLIEPTVSGLVLDLRDNPGGYVDSTVGTSGVFLPDLSVIVHLVSRDEVETVRARGRERASDPEALPMVVIVDGGSASASEILTAALQDHDRVTVVGQPTFGKNSGQSSYHFEPDGTLVGVLHLTTLRWLTPDFRSAIGGFEPDIEMDLPLCLLPEEVARRAISAVRPHVTRVAVTSHPPSGDRYVSGDVITVTVTFDSPVVLDRRGATPTLRIDFDDGPRGALYTSGAGTSDLVFEYIVQPEDEDPDGIGIPADSIQTGRAAIALPSGLEAILAHAAVRPEPAHLVGALAGSDAEGLSFVDISGNSHRSSIELIAELGITRGCNPPANTRFCPDGQVTRAQIATFLARALQLPAADRDYFGDDDGNTHEDNINRLAQAGLTQGCTTNNRYCPDTGVTRAQMATFLARALQLPAADRDYFGDDDGNTHEDNINRLAQAGLTQGCTTNNRYCPRDIVNRAQMATFLVRVISLLQLS